MKINNQIWSALKIFGEEDNRNIFTTYTENFILGCEHELDMSILYFQNNDVKKVKSILNNFKYFGFFNRFLSFIPASVQTVTQGRFIEANASATSKILSMELTTEYKVNAVSVSVQPLGLIH